MRRRKPPEDTPGPPRVTPGELVESPTPSGGIERRAFGEFVSGRGELASYAFGWVAEEDEETATEGRMTVGIGAGNEGGATFHWVVFRDEEGYAYTLVDEPFEQVPEGGPDITAEAARAHDALQFVFWVGDTVMREDPRAVWMRHWVLGSLAIETRQVAERAEPILLVVLDDDDRVPWQLIGTSDAGDDGKIEHLHHHLEQDPSLLEPVARLVAGQEAVRDAPDAPWRYLSSPDPDP